MLESTVYSARTVFEGLRKTFHQYLEAQYHIWDEGLIAERRRLLDCPGVSFQEPRLEATPFYVNGKRYSQLSIPTPAQAILTLASRRSNVGIYPEPYVHQAAAIEAFLGRDEEIIVATGTGSGKTESFLMPILGALAVESSQRARSWALPGVRALLLYPMNALVNDQLARLRRLMGDDEVANALRGARDRRATFGMYTSRTPYPGMSTPAKDRDRIGKLLEHLYQDLTEQARDRLEQEGKWPAKDIDRFIASLFCTGSDDSELFSRQEMQTAAPDLLVTNYSMLEYMLLRPLERSIFEQTTHWLKSNSENRFIVVLDEAHVYRGSGGAEVAYLLRRLHSRLGVNRDRVRYILTSASLGTSDEAQRAIRTFAKNLTGLERSCRNFTLITGNVDRKQDERTGTPAEVDALAEYDFVTLHRVYDVASPAEESLRQLLKALGNRVPDGRMEEKELKYAIFDWLQSFGPAALAANLLTERPQGLGELARIVFPVGERAERALESLFALMSFAREARTERVFAPVRSHLFFRGLPGLFACVNPMCEGRAVHSGPHLLGRLFSTPQLRCTCGSRVYELLTHRDCGAAFLRGYTRSERDEFLWHEPTTGLWSEGALLESHFLVEVERKSTQQSGRVEGSAIWLHMSTGRMETREPPSEVMKDYLPLLRPDGIVAERGRIIHSFNGECPVCVRSWQGTSKIMDLATKGEAPFAHLVREQVALQPITQRPTDESPNGGRKALSFSDGRQKAARLARDIPREIEQDVFRQAILLAANELKAIGQEPTLRHSIYVAFLDVLAKTGLQFFDGDDRHALQRDVREYRRWHDGNLGDAIREFDGSAPPPRFSALLLRQLGSRFYSFNALTLAHILPTGKALRAIVENDTALHKGELLALSAIWLQGFADAFAFDPTIRPGIRQQAAGYPVTGGLAAKQGFSKRQQQFLAQRQIQLEPLVKELAAALCESDPSGGLFLAPKRVKLEVAVQGLWHQCLACTAVSPVSWWGHCPNCLSPGVTPVEPGTTSYLRARKGFWRDPVVLALQGKEKPLNLTVEEHTAQLSYRDVDEPNPTTEDFERRFRDILIRPGDTSIDVLSSTTTMEVGIDIGSLVAVGLRNIPPLRQNYQQRAGRAGRRGSAISTVLTYAQNNPHDNHYFESPERIIAGEPTLPAVDTNNAKIIERHVRAQLIQAFFHSIGTARGSANVFTMLGETWDFYVGKGDFSLMAFKNWVDASSNVQDCYKSIEEWLPGNFDRRPSSIANDFLTSIERVRPKSPDDLDQSDEYLIEFLFSHGFLPSYAFPRDLCALQIEHERAGPSQRVRIAQRPQQGLNIALSEYAPGRLVVVDKKTYRVGTVAASGTSAVVNRAERLFSGQRMYVHCSACLFTAGFLHEFIDGRECPLCRVGELSAVTVVQPEVAYPDGGREVDEYDDEQIYSQATGAQLPMPEGEAPFEWRPFLASGKLAFARNHPLVMVNKGQENAGEAKGFLVCKRCGKTSLDGTALGAHRRDYRIDPRKGEPRPSHTCNGEFQRVYLGYSFTSDILLLRLPIQPPIRFDPVIKRLRQPLADALQSLCEALVLAVGRELDIDIREINAGYRFVKHGDQNFADIFVYDTLSGGAGYATEAGEVFPAVFRHVKSILAQCDCSSSCDKCLRHYGNRFHHGSLDRLLALDLVRLISDGKTPLEFDRVQQQTKLAPLAEMLSLAGWQLSQDKNAPLEVTRDGMSIGVWCFPSLVDPGALGFLESPAAHAFSPFELNKDLPGAYAEIV